MIKKTLYFGNPAKLRLKDLQLRIIKDKEERTIPIEDIGVVILDHFGITLSHAVLDVLLANNVALITTDQIHLPTGMFLPLVSNSLQTERFREQIKAGKPLKKQLWQQTVKSKIRNQAGLLKQLGIDHKFLLNLIPKVQSDDRGNHESQAARYYWNNLFDPFLFKRYRFGKPPNNLLNYGYAILRSVIARALTGSGLLPSLGIHHRNKYNAYTLADDIMEPYRPYVDEIVWNLAMNEYDISTLSPTIKKELLEIPSIAVKIAGENHPLMNAASRTTASLQRCFSGESRKIIYPECG
jgi:CRISPR-associated protein Cas1